MIRNCPICKSNNTTSLKIISGIPVFQNKIYSTAKEAKLCKKGDVNLVQCNSCSFAYNGTFDSTIMDYNLDYQNEQNHSGYFIKYLEGIRELLKQKGFTNYKILEIGCGKGWFLNMLNEMGWDAWGIDPTYEGNNPKIIKDYFSEKYSNLKTNAIILRHTLEHIAEPYEFLKMIKGFVSDKTLIYIEIPTFDWIIKKCAFWDFHYEHCNYFTPISLSNVFDECTSGLLFNDQYMYIIGELGKVKLTVSSIKFEPYNLSNFDAEKIKFKELLSTHSDLSIWGAGAKGSTFLNLMDNDMQFVKYVIDSNPKKQNKFIGGTGHPIFSPNIVKENPTKTILVMNENYLTEIRNLVPDSIKLISL